MKNAIFIMPSKGCDNYQNVTSRIQCIIASYFGNKIATMDDKYPIVRIEGEVTQADLEYLYQSIPKSVVLTVIVNTNSDQCKGDFIYLNAKEK